MDAENPRRKHAHGEAAPWRVSCWLADPLLGRPVPVARTADLVTIRPLGPADHALAELWISSRDAAIFESRYDSGTDRSQLRMTRIRMTRTARTLPSEMVRAAGRRLPGRIVYSEDDGSKVGMETELRLTHREIREPLEAALFEPARFHLPTLDAGRRAGAVGVERAFAGGAGR
jgi:hypothetical protein